METVDFNNPNRPKTCLEVDFPIVPINQIAVIEGNAGKPIYQMSKWWARRRSSVFRSLLLAAAMKAPSDPAQAAKAVWEVYYANHQKKGAFKDLKVADIFMGGGTTVVEGSRLGMQLFGVDLNPVAWFVVKQELAQVDLEEVKRLLADIEAEVKPQIMPFYYCDGPNGEKGRWTHLPSGQVMGEDFDPLALTPAERPDYHYEGPEIIYTFWAKHGPCQVTGCGHRTPTMTSPVMAIKTLSVKHWPHQCAECGAAFEIEDKTVRMAPDVPLSVAPEETPYAVLNWEPDREKGQVSCPHCGHVQRARMTKKDGLVLETRRGLIKPGKGKNKKVDMTLLVHPEWLAGSPNVDAQGQAFGGSAQDDAESTARWNAERAAHIRLLEVRGDLPETVTCPETGVTFKTGKEGGTAKPGQFSCGSCGTAQEVISALRPTEKTAPFSAYAIQAYSPSKNPSASGYGGRFFTKFDEKLAKQLNAATQEWENLKHTELTNYWPKYEIPDGLRPVIKDVIKNGHGYSHWWTMFNPRQLLIQAQLLKSILNVGNYSWDSREYVLGAFQQYLNLNNMFCHWEIGYDKIAQLFSRNNFYPKNTVIENNVFSQLGRGNWDSCYKSVIKGKQWATAPWELVNLEYLARLNPRLAEKFSGKSEKVLLDDLPKDTKIFQGSSTDLACISTESLDLVVTDPPFGDLMQYAELSDFFYVWLRLALKDKYPDIFSSKYSPKSLEVVANSFREPEDPDGFYQRLLTQCWREAHRILKPGGLLAFTFHHSEDEPWINVLESLFDAGFYLEATYPIRSDEIKGEGEFGSQKIEFDIIHVCRKRTDDPQRVSWAKMRRAALSDIQQLRRLLDNHTRDGLQSADLRIIKIGKALEYYSRHYGAVYLNEDTVMSVRDAVLGIKTIIDDDSDPHREPPPANAYPDTRQFLRMFDGGSILKRDQMQKYT
jgi:adenine-specific DNA methylase